MNKFKKMIIMLLLLSIIVLLVSGCSPLDSSSKNSINVFNWGEYIDESILKEFTDKTGIKVNYETYASNEEMYEKVKTGTNKYDILCPSDYMIQRMIKENMLEPIDFSSIPNYKNIDDKYKKQPFDHEDKYSIPYLWGTIGILYDKTQVKEPVDSWNILWDKKYKNQIFMSDDMRNSIGIALKKLGYSFNSKNTGEIKKAADELIKQKKEISPVYVGDQVKDSMRNGEKKIAVMYSGDAIILRNENPDKFRYVIPKEGTNLWFDSWVIPKGAKHKKEAEKFLDFMLDARINKKNVNYVGYATPNKATYNMLDKKIREDKAAYPSQEELKKYEVFTDLGDTREFYSDEWLQVTSK